MQNVQKLRIVYWNIWYRASHTKVLDHLQSLKADVACLFEATQISPWNKTDLKEELKSRFQSSSISACNTRSDHDKNNQSTLVEQTVMVGLTECLIIPGIQHLSNGGRFGTGSSQRQLLEATIVLDNCLPLTIGAVHLSYPRPGNQAQRITEYGIVDDFIKRNRYVIVGGDFNVRPRKLFSDKARRRYNIDGGLVEGNRIDPRFRDPSFFMLPIDRGGLGIRLDYALANPQTQPLVRQAWFAGRGPSNHRPLVIDLAIAE